MDKFINFLRKHQEIIALIVILIWPFIYLFRYAIGDQSFSLKFKMDVVYFYYPMVYLLDSVSHWHFPLWSPAEACGFPFFSSPFNMAFYPLTYILAIFYKFMDGFSWVDYQRYCIFGISIFGYALYKFLRELNINLRAALLATLLFCISYQIAGSANRVQVTHSAAWLMFMLWGVIKTMNPQTKTRGAVTIGLSTFMFFCTSYMYTIYYSIFLFPPLIAAILHPTSRLAITGQKNLNILSYLSTLVISFGIPTLLCAPFLYKTYALFGLTSGRDSSSIKFTQEADFSLQYTLGSLVHPAYSDMRGWYFFGVIALMLVLLYIIYCLFNKNMKLERLRLLLCGVFFVGVSLVTYGDFIVFKTLWHILPGFSSLRAWARMNIILVPVLAYLFAHAYQWFEALVCQKQAQLDSKTPENEQAITTKVASTGQQYLALIAVYGGILTIQLGLLFFGEYGHNWDQNIIFTLSNPFTHKFILNGVFAFIFFLLVIKFKAFFATQLHAKGVLILFISFFALGCNDIGYKHLLFRSQLRSASSVKEVINLPKVVSKSMYLKRNYDISLSKIRSDKPFSALIGKYWYYGSFNGFFEESGGYYKDSDLPNGLKNDNKRPKELDQLLGVIDGKKLYCTKDIGYKQIKPFLEDSENFEQKGLEKPVQVVKYSGEYLELMVKNTQAGYLSFIDNWDQEWHVFVNGEEQNLEKLLGTFKAVKLSKGNNLVQFWYNPFPFSYFRSLPKADKFENIAKLNDNSVYGLKTKAVEWENLSNIAFSKPNTYRNKAKKAAKMVSQNIFEPYQDGIFKFKATKIDKNFSVGFIGAENTFDPIYSFKFNKKGQIEIRVNFDYQATLSEYKIDDEFSIERKDGEIIFKRNGIKIYGQVDKIHTKMKIYANLEEQGAGIRNITSSF